MTEAVIPAPPASQASHQAHVAIVTEATMTSSVVGGEGEADTLSFDTQMIEELLNQPNDPFIDPSFSMSGATPAISVSMPVINISSAAQVSREDEILAEINAEMAAVTAGMDPSGHAPLMMISPGGTVIITSAPVPPPATDFIPPAPPSERISVASSSEEEVDIMSPSEGKSEKSKRRRKKLGSSSSGTSSKKKPRKKKD